MASQNGLEDSPGYDVFLGVATVTLVNQGAPSDRVLRVSVRRRSHDSASEAARPPSGKPPVHSDLVQRWGLVRSLPRPWAEILLRDKAILVRIQPVEERGGEFVASEVAVAIHRAGETVFLTEFGLEMILEDQIDALGFQHADAPESAGGGVILRKRGEGKVSSWVGD